MNPRRETFPTDRGTFTVRGTVKKGIGMACEVDGLEYIIIAKTYEDLESIHDRLSTDKFNRTICSPSGVAHADAFKPV